MVVAVLLPLLVYRSHAIDPGDANVIDKVVLAITGPLNALMLGAVGFVSDTWDGYVDVVDAGRENAELRVRLRKLERERDRYEALEIEHAHLSRLLQLDQANPDTDFVAARVIGAGIAPTSRTLAIDRGSLDGLVRGQPVLDDRGLVGVVLRVGWKQAEVLLIADDQMTVHANVVRTGARGRIRGLGLAPAFRIQLTEVLRSDDVVPGDRIVTSGLDGVFPRGIPIGIVSAVRTLEGVQHRVADVEPHVDFARVQRVLVIVTAPTPEQLATPEALLPASLQTQTSTEAP